MIHVYTGDVIHAGTNANVFATIYGENGDSGERKLQKSEKHLDKFERNQVRAFLLSQHMRISCQYKINMRC